MAIERLPLFALKTVLMPGMVLPLRIFEPRYRLMMQRVLAGERRFGVLLIRRGAEVGARRWVREQSPTTWGRSRSSQPSSRWEAA
jgi:Lon protease-like protein